ncbi:nucleoid-associated protein [Janthinobacterium sp. B9-8]|uniref:nucleoid-associated protein n=1 Tax=Janthinobacterium sp. B9-8 TaxID=1236179 RepID=UPI00061D1A6B|nr:nucleoid-associated protein [Janthinobacterium sp. B9-8]AMC34314.1 nucleoid-associated protein [Janthinobacterium sp. B9-8]
MTTNTISNLISHQINKEAHGPVSLRLSDKEITHTPAAQRLIDQLCKLYTQKLGKGFGSFEEDQEAFPMQGLVRQLMEGADFLASSQQMMQHLLLRLEQEPLASGGHVLIARVKSDGADFILFTILSEIMGTMLDENLNVADSIYLDTANLKVAGKIDLHAWQNGAERYISFLRGRGDVAAYFKSFLGCNDIVVALKETQKLVHGLSQFAEEQHLQPAERDQLFERAHEYLDELGNASCPVTLEQVAEQVWPDAPMQLQNVLGHQDLELTNGFVPDRRAIKPLRTFKTKAPHWKLEFDRSSLRSGAVHYNPENDTLVLSNIPEEMRKELLAETN